MQKSAAATQDGVDETAVIQGHRLRFTTVGLAADTSAIRAELLRVTVPMAVWRFGVNETFMTAAGILTIGVGPGDEIWAHTPEQHVSVDESHMVTRALARLIAGITQARAL